MIREITVVGHYVLGELLELETWQPVFFIAFFLFLQGSTNSFNPPRIISSIEKTVLGNRWIRRGSQISRLVQENSFLLHLYLPNLFDIVTTWPMPTPAGPKRIHFHPGTGILADPKWEDWIDCYKGQKAKLYASVYYNKDLWLGDLWNVQTGYGRWNYILKDNLPSPRGKRILDLGANSGANSLRLLREGAREVVAVELNQDQIDLGRLLLEGFERMDQRRYDLTYIHSNMNHITSMDLGRFDMVMALCSLYYLTDEEMAKVTEHVAAITDTFVLECNTGNVERNETHLYQKASVEYAMALLKNRGFPDVEIIGPTGYYRPLVIGRKSGSS